MGSDPAVNLGPLPGNQDVDVTETLLMTAVLWATHELAFFTFCGLYAVFHRLGIARRFAVREGQAPPVEIQRRAWREVLVGHVALLLGLAVGAVPLWQVMGGDLSAPMPSGWTVAGHVLACLVIQDTIFYWSHRALHTKRLFRAIHRKHHDFRYVRGVAAEYAHPVETLANFVALVTGPVLLAVHPVTFVLWIGLRVVETVEAHSGYAFTALASRHAYHHLYAARGCLGSFFGLWDWLMGTDAHWRQWRQQQTHR